MNKCIFSGRLTAEPQLRQTTAGVSVCTFTLAVNRPKQKDKEQETDFLTIVAWRSRAEFVANYLHKGNKIIVEAAARTRRYEKEGQTHYITEFYADNIEFAESAGTQQSKPNYSGAANTQPPQQNGLGNMDGFADIDDGKAPWDD